MNIDSLFSNPLVKKAGLGTLRKAMSNNNLTAIVVRMAKEGTHPEGAIVEGDMSFQLFTEDCVMISRADLELYQAAVIKNLSNGSQPDEEHAP